MKLARIMKNYEGDDGKVRVIDIKFSRGMLDKNITGIAFLPFFAIL